ncbi:MAG: Glu-tRNA(Gln) amidotransferase subunit GatE [Thermoplasmatota archaeon]
MSGASGMSGDEARRLAVEADAGELDYEALGFKCGLEIHQQLDTTKLHCPCPSQVVDPDEVARRATVQVDRRLRATQSELGDTDAAALAEARRRRSFRYLALQDATCLVELDEEPPHPLNPDALDVTLQLAGLVGATPAAEVHVMRKTVIDGSNTSGFQRTALVATGGSIDASVEDPAYPDVPVWTIAVEEDSARKLAEGPGGLVTYTLDRLGIPLIELATGPGIVDPFHAQATARRIGGLLRATGRVKRGLGTIRQDLNVSIGVGDRVEIKGCQDLRAVPKVIENEVRRQLWLHHIRESLAERGFDPDVVPEPVDVTEAFAASQSKVVKGALKRKGKVLALGLPKWNGLIQGGAKDGPRMGREFADHAKVAAGVRGVFHSDELPAYGIELPEVEGVHKSLGLGPDDAFVLCVEQEPVARRALEAVAERARAATGPSPKEVRAAQPDDSTRYLRPLPGAARMYPETDIPPSPVGADVWNDVLARLPARPEEVVARLTTGGLSEDLAGQMVRDGRVAAYDDLLAAGGEPALVARILLQLLPERTNQEALLARVPELLSALADGAFAKEALPELLVALDDEPTMGIEAAIQAAGVAAADASLVDDIVAKVIADRMDFVKERGMGAMGPLMGPVMAELRGKADGKAVSDALKKHLGAALA